MKNGKEVRNLNEGSYFGERSVLENEVRSASVVAATECICWELFKDDFHRLIDKSVILQMIQNISL
jgi:CRP-like cAMP-binding protein